MFDRLPAEAPPPYYPNSEDSKNAASSADKASTDDKRPPESPQISQKARDVIKSLDNLQENALMQLKKYDTIVVLDDSESMNDENRWQDVRFHCQRLASNFSPTASSSSRRASLLRYSVKSSPNTTPMEWICVS